jgi:hypothetical protein
MAFPEAPRAARCAISGVPLKSSHLSKHRGLPAIFSSNSQASAQITERAENHLAEIESRLARVGQAVALGHADRNMVADRMRAALVRANLNTESRR